MQNCLKSILTQDLSGVEEILVYFDEATQCSHDIINELLCTYSNASLIRPIYASGKTKGVSHAKNFLIEEALADYILLMADDLILKPGSIQALIVAISTSANPCTSHVGLVEWHTGTQPNKFMEWIVDTGPQSNYSTMKSGLGHDFTKYYGWLVCSSKHMLLMEKYDQMFEYPRYDDLELAYRLEKSQLFKHEINFLPTLSALHDDHVTFHQWISRTRKFANNCIMFLQKHDNEVLWRLFSGNLARELETFDYAALLFAVQNFRIQQNEEFKSEVACFGTQFKANLLWECFRVLQQFFMVTQMRDLMNLPPLTSNDLNVSIKNHIEMREILLTAIFEIEQEYGK